MHAPVRGGGAYGEDGSGGAQQQQGVVVSLGHVGRPDDLDHQLHAELLFVQDVCGERTQSVNACSGRTLEAPPPRPPPHLQPEGLRRPIAWCRRLAGS